MVNDSEPGPVGERTDAEGKPGTWCIACDANGCFTMFTYKGTYGEELIERARLQAQSQGWWVTNKADFCPDHASSNTMWVRPAQKESRHD